MKLEGTVNMTIEEIKTPDDILQFMEENIRYGWLDINDEEHIGNLENVRRLYRTASIEESLEHKLGACVEQVNLMHHLLDTLGIPNKMFCTRVYEIDDFNDLKIFPINFYRLRNLDRRYRYLN